MKLEEYKLTDWKANKIKKKKIIASKLILLLDIDRTVSPPKSGRKNLLAIDNESNIIWIAELPTEYYDSYYEIKYENGILYARSSNSFIAEINPKTGEIMKSYMVK